jgi:hypothetical protein
MNFQERVITEKRELDNKLDKLQAFINEGTVYAQLPKEERSRLARQATVMIEYSQILADRIAKFQGYDPTKIWSL